MEKDILMSNKYYKTFKEKDIVNNSAFFKKPLRNENFFCSNIYNSIIGEDLPVENYISKNTKRILEIGCGTGTHLYAIKKKYPDIECIGVDISKSNIEIANKNKLSGLNFYNEDYQKLKIKPVDLIMSHGTFGFLSMKEDVLFNKLSNELNVGGKLLFSIHKDCLYNKTINKLSKLIRVINKNFAINSLAKIRKYFYPNVDKSVLEDRIKYIYLSVNLIMNSNMRKQLQENNFNIIDNINLSKNSFSIYKYVLVCCEKVK